MKNERINSSKTNSLSSYLDNSMDSFKSDVNEIPNYKPHNYGDFKFWKSGTYTLLYFMIKLNKSSIHTK